MKVKKVTIEGFHNVGKKSYEFKDFNYLIGKNASGKTTAMQAVQLALLGYIPGTNKRTSDIFRHANNHTMAVTVVLDDGGVTVSVRRIWTGTKSSINSSVDVDPDGYNIDNILYDIELPIFNFNEFLGMTANKMKDWFINFLPKSEFQISWKDELTKNVDEVYLSNPEVVSDIDKAVKDITLSDKTGTDQIRWANDYFKQCLSFKKSELDRITGTIQSMIYYDDVPDDRSYEEVSSTISELYKRKSAHEVAVRSKEYNDSIYERIYLVRSKCKNENYESDPEYVDTLDKLNKIKVRLSEPDKDYSSELLELKNKASNLKSDMTFMYKVINSGGTCPITLEGCESISERIKKYKKDYNKTKAEFDSVSNKISEIEKLSSEETRKRSSLETEYRNCSAKLSEIQSNYNKIAELSHLLKPVNEAELNDTDDYDAIIQKLNSDLAKIESNKRYNEMIDTFTGQKFTIQSEIEVYKKWVNLTGVNGLQNSSEGTGPFEYLKDDMDKRVPQLFGSDVTSEFHLEAKANSFSFGIKRGGDYIPYDLLSSGEKCMYSLCLMMSLVDCSKSPLKLIMVDDLFDHLDDDNIDKLFDSLYNVHDIQMIFAGVKRPKVSGHDDFFIEVK